MSQGAMTKFGISTSNPVDAAFEATRFTLTSRKAHIHANGMRGTRSQISGRVIEGPEEVGGEIEMCPNPEEAALLFPWILGANASGTTYALADALTSRYITADKVQKVATYSGCYVNALTLRAAKGECWRWTMDIIGQQETIGNAGTFPALSLTETAPLALHHGVFTIAGSARDVAEFTLRVDNALQADTFNNDYATLIEPTDRIVSVSLLLPYTSANTDLVRQAVAGAAGSAVFTFGNYSTTFTFAALQFPRGAVEVPGKSGVMLQLDGVSRMSGSTRELVVTHDSTP